LSAARELQGSAIMLKSDAHAHTLSLLVVGHSSRKRGVLESSKRR